MMSESNSSTTLPPRPVPWRLTPRMWMILALVLVVAGFLRIYKIGKDNMWLDEIWAVEMATGRDALHDHLPLNEIHKDDIPLTSLSDAPPWWNVYANMKGIIYPPLYYIVLRLWMDVFGGDVVGARSLSALCSILSVAVFFDVCRFTFRPISAFLATILMMIALAQVDWAQQSRAYAMMILLALCTGDALLRIEAFGATRRRLIALTSLIFLTAMTHYLSAGTLIGFAIYAFLRLRGRERWKTLATFPAAALLALIFWGYGFYKQKMALPNFSPDYLVTPHGYVTEAILRLLAILPGRFLFSEKEPFAPDPMEQINVVWWFVVICIFVMIVPIIRWMAGRRDQAFWIIWAWMTIGLVAVLDWLGGTHSLQFLRYSLLASPAVYALIASFEWPKRAALKHLVAIATILGVGYYTIQRAQAGPPDLGDMKVFARNLDQAVPKDGLIIFYNRSPWMTPGVWYMCWKYYSPQSHRDWLALMAPANAKILGQIGSYKSVWLAGYDSHPVEDGARVLPGWRVEGNVIQCSAGTIVRMVPF